MDFSIKGINFTRKLRHIIMGENGKICVYFKPQVPNVFEYIEIDPEEFKPDSIRYELVVLLKKLN